MQKGYKKHQTKLDHKATHRTKSTFVQVKLTKKVNIWSHASYSRAIEIVVASRPSILQRCCKEHIWWHAMIGDVVRSSATSQIVCQRGVSLIGSRNGTLRSPDYMFNFCLVYNLSCPAFLDHRQSVVYKVSAGNVLVFLFFFFFFFNDSIWSR